MLRGADRPVAPVAGLSDSEILEVVRAARPAMQKSAEHGGRVTAAIYDRAGLPCPRCDAPIRARGQGDEARTTYWCPACQD